MRKSCILGVVVTAGAVLFLLLAHHYRGEHYQIVHATFVTGDNLDVLVNGPTVCYSNKELKEAIKSADVLDKAGMNAFNLDESNLLACVTSNYVVEDVVARQDFGLILLRRSATNGISFTVIKGTKRFLQFNYQ